MLYYILKRLLLLPLTLFCIVMVNFVIINLAPGEPVYMSELGTGDAAKSERFASATGGDERYLQFRQFFGLTLPILFNTWPFIGYQELLTNLQMLSDKKDQSGKELSAKKFSDLKIQLGDEAPFVLPKLITIMEDKKLPFPVRKLAMMLFFRGATQFAYIGANLSTKQKKANEIIAKNNLFLDNLRVSPRDTIKQFEAVATELHVWYNLHKQELNSEPTTLQKISIFFFDTRFFRYLSRVCTLDFGVLRQDTNRSVIGEVVSRLKYSLTLAIIPMIVTFFLCQLFGLFMAIWKNSFFDISLSLVFLIFYATPVFVIGPFLIEKVALHHNYPFTDIPFPIRGFSSEDSIFNSYTSLQRVLDVARHITLPLLTIFYGSLAVQSRLSRAIFIETLHQDFVRTAQAKGVSRFALYAIHVGRSAAIPILTAVAGSLGLILGGSVIIETIFEIHGFGKFFYDAIIERDYNVMMFSALVGSFLALAGYLIADITYMCLDPRVTLESKKS
jgi:peptide/nickel transport system permease protein